jgi:hypothetical protein
MVSKNRITVNLSIAEHRDLCALSEKHSVSLAWLGRRAIVDFLAKCRDGGPFPTPGAAHNPVDFQRAQSRKARGKPTAYRRERRTTR